MGLHDVLVAITMPINNVDHTVRTVEARPCITCSTGHIIYGIDIVVKSSTFPRGSISFKIIHPLICWQETSQSDCLSN